MARARAWPPATRAAGRGYARAVWAAAPLGPATKTDFFFFVHTGYTHAVTSSLPNNHPATTSVSGAGEAASPLPLPLPLPPSSSPANKLAP